MHPYIELNAHHIGKSHVQNGLTCEDYSASYSDDQVSIVVISDGHGDKNCFRSDKGARYACEIAISLCRQFQSITNHINDIDQCDFESLVVSLESDIADAWKEKVLSDANAQPISDEELLIGHILQGVHNVQDDVVWDYSKTTQDTVELIGGCPHGIEAFRYFKPGFKKDDLPAIVFKGRSWKDIPYDKLSPRLKKIADDPKKYHAPKFFRRFAFGEINGTITASAQPENCGITHPVENRRYSVRECARIQSFPDEYCFGSIPLQSQYKVIGNAVPPILGWVIAKALLNFLPE